ncbi:MAG: hypothetical protein GY772_17115, partial [bacterium]|nr:hypothetical protein [bacterium]
MIDLVEQQKANPAGCPTRSREACVRDLATAWSHTEIHARGARGFWDNLLAVALDGSEDHLGRGAAKKLWNDLGMAALRAQALHDVDEAWRSEDLRWRDARKVIQAFPKRGQLDVYLEGQEDEGDVDAINHEAALWREADQVSDEETDSETKGRCAGG